MCTHCRTVYNPYSRRTLLVKCGKCPSCLQEKAFARARRIKNNLDDGMICLFFTLTYANDYLPYLDRMDLYEDCFNEDIAIYRNASIRQVYDRHSDKLRWKKTLERDIIAYVNPVDIDFHDIDKIPSPTGMPSSYISVCWYPDIQDFYKRLRNFLNRKNNYEKRFSYYSCSEYGSFKKRSHFHGLLFIPREDEALFRTAIVESWPFADKTRTAKFIEVARDAANYVASYVNSSSRIFPLLQADCFKQKHSQSKDFGVVLDCFSLRSILKKIDEGDLFYYIRKKFDGTSDVRKLPIPLYVLYRYFPKCKGFSWLDSQQLRAILLDPQRVGDILTDVDVTFKYERSVYDYDRTSHSYLPCLDISHIVNVRRSCKLINPLYHYTSQDTYKIYVRLENCYQRFHRETGLSRYDYAFYYERVYSLYASMVEKTLHEDVVFVDDYAEFYDNAFEVLHNNDISPSLALLDLVADPNKRSFVMNETARNTSLYSRLNKQRDVTNYAMVHLGYDV